MHESTFSLMSASWLPVRRRSGARSFIAPHQIVEAIGVDPVLAPDWGRADFDAASLEFLIGLIATTLAPTELVEWKERFDTPPTADELAAAFAHVEPAFRLDGTGPRFLQERDLPADDVSPVAGLLIEAPGANTEKNNTDLFQKRGQVAVLGLPAAAMALYTLQTYAPSGGAGHRTSLRGGGPLTTLALPHDAEDTLWRRLWLNVPYATEPVSGDLPRVFAWLGSTRTSEGESVPVGPDDIHLLAVFWGMPRRIRLDFAPQPSGTVCSLTGEPITIGVATYRMRPWGMNYAVPTHPLSPMYRAKPASAEWLYTHPQAGGLTYRHWIDMACAGDQQSATRRAASAVLTARGRLRAIRLGRGRLWAAGYDMDNMKARGFVEAVFPLFVLADSQATEQLDALARNLVAAASEVAFLATKAVGAALNLEGSDKSRLAALREDFLAQTEVAFFTALHRLSDRLAADPDDGEALAAVSRPFFEQTLRPAAFAIFDRDVPLISLGAREAERIVAARSGLTAHLNGISKPGLKLFGMLGLPAPERRGGGKKRRA
jgi:CRISPR system Cascade subunit CasA